MGTNTMVAAVGLVIGPVLGGALVAISWHWVFWFNVPFGLAGSLWGCSILHEITGRSEDRSFDYLGTITFLIGLTGLVLRHLQGRDLGLELAAGHRRPDRRGRVPARLRAHRAPPQGADARPVASSRPAVLDRLGAPRSPTGWRASR